MRACVLIGGLVLLAFCGSTLVARDWPGWRGPEQNGVSREIGLPDKISLGGGATGGTGSPLWSLAEGGRSTPVVMDGRLYLVNRAGSGIHEQERLMCVDARTGKKLWEHRFNVYLTDIPSARVGWASPAGDPQTGHVYVHGVQNKFACLDGEGHVVWERSLHEELGVIMGYGGRTHTPVIDGGLVILSFLNSSWGTHSRGRHRYVACDKHTGEIVWWSEPGGPPYDTTYSTPVVAEVGGVRLLIGGNADGNIYAMKVRTGEKVWAFRLSKRGINSSVVFSGGRVYASHSEENVHLPGTMGCLVAIDATGAGDVTDTHVRWRLNGFLVGYSSPAVHDGRLYAIDNAATLMCVDAASGSKLWELKLGRVMKGSPVVADGKLYVGEANGSFLVVELGETSGSIVSKVTFERPDGTVVEIFGAPAVAGGRVYFATTDGLYCFGEKTRGGAHETPLGVIATSPPPTSGGTPAHLQIAPADVLLQPAGSVTFEGKLFDNKGVFLRNCSPRLRLEGVRADLSESGRLTVSSDNLFQQGVLKARLEDLEATVRLRVVPHLPFVANFDEGEDGKPPVGWVGAGIKFVTTTLEGEKVLTKVGRNPRFMDAETFFGMATWRNYTVEADVRALERKRQLPNIGLVNSRYEFILMGNHQEFKVVSWVPQPRVQKTVDFPWDPDKWYRMKVRVQVAGQKALARAKVWPRQEPEPQEWLLDVEDPTPNQGGSPALHGYSAGASDRSPGAQIFYDNVKVYRNEN